MDGGRTAVGLSPPVLVCRSEPGCGGCASGRVRASPLLSLPPDDSSPAPSHPVTSHKTGCELAWQTPGANCRSRGTWASKEPPPLSQVLPTHVLVGADQEAAMQSVAQMACAGAPVTECVCARVCTRARAHAANISQNG